MSLSLSDRIAERDFESVAEAIAAKANECCYRGDGYEDEIKSLILAALKEAYAAGRSFE